MSKYALIGLLIAAMAVPLVAAPPATTQSQPAGKPITVTVASASGPAQKLVTAAGQRKWEALKAGDKLNEMSVIRTGFGAKVVLRFEDRAEVTINDACKVGIAHVRRKGTLAETRLGVKYGAIYAKVEKGRGPNDFRVSTPVAVASVRGSQGAVGYSGDQGLSVQGDAGTWNVATSFGTRSLVPGEHTNGSLEASMDLLLDNRDTKMGDAMGGLTKGEVENLSKNGGGQGIFGFVGNKDASGAPPTTAPPKVQRPSDWIY